MQQKENLSAIEKKYFALCRAARIEREHSGNLIKVDPGKTQMELVDL
jgi:hypothetical protein